MVMIIQMMTTISGMIENYGNDHPDDDNDLRDDREIW